ncbi:MAG: hypothetical protein U1F43_29565 [Myxococcota bacterium]
MVVAAAGAFAPFALDTTTWAVATSVLVAGALAFLPDRRAAAPVAVASPVGAALERAEPDPLPGILASLGHPPLAERRPAVTGAAAFPARVALAALSGDAVAAAAPSGTGKTGAGLEVALTRALAGVETWWIAPDATTAEAARDRFARAPEAIVLAPFRTFTPAELTAAEAGADLGGPSVQVIIDDADLLTGAELAAIRQALVRLAPRARLLILGALPAPAMDAVAQALTARALTVLAPRPHELLPTAAVERWLVERLPDPLPTAPRAIFRVLGARDAQRFLGARPRYATPMREVLALDGHAARRRKFAPEAPRALAPSPLNDAARAALHRAVAAGVRDPERRMPAVGAALVERELAALSAARVPHALSSPATGAAPTTPAPAWPGTPIRTTRVRLVGPDARTRHRFLGPAEVELVTTRVELTRTAHGHREHGPDQQRAHTRTVLAEALPPLVVEARLLVLPTADATVLHTLAHVVRDLAPWFFRGADDLLGVTTATAAELGPSLGSDRGALVVHDLDPHGPGAVHDLQPADWQALLQAAHALLADCDCAAHCARCCESTSCTATPHNVELDRVRTLAVLEGVLRPLRQVA